MGSMDLNVRVINNAGAGVDLLVYQQPANLNVKNYLTGAWKTATLTNNNAHWDFILPFSIEVQGRTGASTGVLTTNTLVADYDGQYLMSMKNGTEFLMEQLGTGAGDNTISVENGVRSGPRDAVVTKQGSPLFSSCVRPNERVSFEVKPTINFAISSNYQQGQLFSAVNLTNIWEFPFQGQNNLIVTVTQNPSTQEISLTPQFTKSINSFQTSCDCG